MRSASEGMRRRVWANLWVVLLLAILGFLVIYPILMLLLGSLTDTNPVVEGISLRHLSIANFLVVLANPNVGEALVNTLIACGGGTAIAVVIGLLFSWIVVRTNTPFKGFIAAASILPLFAPPLVAGVAWAILGSPKTGLINTMFKWIGLDWRVDFYSLWGLVFVFGIYYAPYVYMFTSSALRNMDPSLEEAAEISGASAFATLFSVTFPLIMPAIISGMLLSFIVMLGIYGIPAVLGSSTNLALLTTYIFKLTNWSPPLYNTAAAVAIILMVVTGALVFLQNRVLSGRSYTTVAGKAFRPRSLDLGRWRWFTFAIGIVYLLIVVVLPLLALIVAAFRKFMFIRDVSSLFDMRQYSMVHFNSIFDNPLTLRSIYNAVEVGVITAVVGGALAFAIGYTIHRTQLTGRRWIDLISTVPVAIPGLVVGVAYLWAWIGIPGGLYGTIWILALAFIARFMPDTVKALSTSFMQIHRELEEAAWVCGRGMFATIRTIVLPLARPGVIASMTLLFVLAIRELGSSLFLYTSNTMVMSVLLLDYYEGGNLGKTAAFSLVQTVLLGVLIGGANWLSREATQSGVARTG
ncbi:iron ABC transporter permease [Bradyrhizobium sp. AUGA SZCCT0240]|uniref:ABC transporter permease n=1 Tax=unclassified Bradyrhizobium TaxID=2631580 RepID=UPI001BABF27C|nr:MULTISPECIES: iron ABC transporter permease [unclassified Bradyrhizobium]MBR1196724.1 iron ABC transporter permease [Bradyrhizobium sp. AUGA SZCCT0158]MBR1241373.1 iron ABC transporter permease [Bradyrhizobium sp. AUGA SZCCT0274]MBR1250239.1 iron ABC transporter permease [Bradyrhizobium sp. AUGA SZCCT0169]MBR1252745.1 iron ABC transporter permease [Bradyrhizobium sp. AUGA SZCCT0240]